MIADRAEVMPVALGDDAVEGDTVAGSAPCEKKDIRIGGGDGFGSGLGSRCADEGASGCGDKFGGPRLGVDEGLAPLFAVDGGLGEDACVGLRGGEGFLEGFDEGFGFGGAIDLAGYEAGVLEDVGEVVRRERQDGQAGF